MIEWLEKFLSTSVVVTDITSVIAKFSGHVQLVRKVIIYELPKYNTHNYVSHGRPLKIQNGGEGVSNTTIFKKESLKPDWNFQSDMNGGRGGSSQKRYSIFLSR